jgi:hypothetical protein
MLSIEECRALIPNNEDVSDEQIEELRKSMYELAKLALEIYFEEKRTENTEKRSGLSSD